MKKGSIGSLVILILMALAGFVLFSYVKKYAKSPNEKTQNTTKSIVKYPENRKWQFEEKKNFCIFATDDCSQPIIINFTSGDSWDSVYKFYTNQLPYDGWQTNSTVYTRIPDQAVFKKEDCEAVLEKNKDDAGYKITVVCRES